MKLLADKPVRAEVSEVVLKDVTPPDTVSTNVTPYTRAGWLIVLAGFVGFLIWASFAPLDKGVPMSGSVTKETSKKAVQHQAGGTVADILVKDGDIVKAGQVLVRMNNVVVKSEADMTRSQYYTARAAEARLLAERDGKATVAFPPSLQADRNDPRVAEVMTLQTQLFNSRRSTLQSEMASVNESIAGLRSQVAALQETRDSKKEQMKLLKSQLEGLRDLSKDGYIARNRLLEQERAYAQLSGALAEDIGNLGKTQRQISELTARQAQRREEYQKEVRTQLVEVQKEAEALQSRMTAKDFETGLAEVKAPVSGTVVGLAVFTRGGVVPPGARLMEIVPTEDALVVEGQLPVHLVDKVHVGLPVDLIFSAFNANRTPHIPGEVIAVSADRFTDEHNGMPYYKVRARVTPEGAKMASKLAIRPGMPVDLFVKTGERTLMSYLLKPLMDRAKMSLTEE